MPQGGQAVSRRLTARGRTLSIVVLVVGGLVLSVSAVVPATAEPAPVSGTTGATSLVGVAGFSEGSSILFAGNAALRRELDGIAATGAKWLRVDVYWGIVERRHGTFDWDVPDRIVEAARAHGLSVLGVLLTTPRWARPAGTSDKHPPTHPGAFATFARAAANHYRGTVAAFEIWNEPNIDMFWRPRPDAAAYTELLRPAYEAIKRVSPGVPVLTGGLSPAPDADDGSAIAPVTFLEGIYASGGGGSFDVVGHHPSNYPYMPGRREQIYNHNAFAGVTPRLHEVMVEHGDGAKRIWATEMGAPTPFELYGHKMTPKYLAAYITEAFRAWRQWTWTGPLFWYSFRDAGTDPSDFESNFGLVRRDFTPKEPALSAARAAMTG
jgi:hypothetical protein